MKSFSKNGNEQIGGNGRPDLGFDGVGGGSVERLDAQVLFDPFEEQFDLPARLEQFGYGHSVELKIVGQKHQRSIFFGIEVANAPQRVGVLLRRIERRKQNRLIADQSRGAVDRMGIAPPEVETFSGSGHKERLGLVKDVESLEIQVSPVHDVEGSGNGCEHIQNVYIVKQTIGNMNKFGDIASEVEQCVQLDSRLGCPERSPGKKRKAQIDGRGIQGVDRCVQVEAQFLLGIKLPGFGNEDLCEVRVDTPVSGFVGMREVVPRDRAANAHVVELRAHRTKTSLDVAKTFAKGELSECQDAEMLCTRECLDLVIASVAIDAGIEATPRNMGHQLRKYRRTGIHRPSSKSVGRRIRAKSSRCRSSFVTTLVKQTC